MVVVGLGWGEKANLDGERLRAGENFGRRRKSKKKDNSLFSIPWTGRIFWSSCVKTRLGRKKQRFLRGLKLDAFLTSHFTNQDIFVVVVPDQCGQTSLRKKSKVAPSWILTSPAYSNKQTNKNCFGIRIWEKRASWAISPLDSLRVPFWNRPPRPPPPTCFFMSYTCGNYAKK